MARLDLIRCTNNKNLQIVACFVADDFVYLVCLSVVVCTHWAGVCVTCSRINQILCAVSTITLWWRVVVRPEAYIQSHYYACIVIFGKTIMFLLSQNICGFHVVSDFATIISIWKHATLHSLSFLKSALLKYILSYHIFLHYLPG